VALSGAHALGRCHADRSGFDGPWTNAPTAWSNLYFQELLEKKWVKVRRMVFARQTSSCAVAGVAGERILAPHADTRLSMHMLVAFSVVGHSEEWQMTADQSSSLNTHCTCNFPAAEQAGLQLEGSRAVPGQGDAATHDAANGHVAHLGQVRAHPIALLLLLASYIICAIKIKTSDSHMSPRLGSRM